MMKRFIAIALLFACCSISQGADVRVGTYGYATDPNPRSMRNLVCTSTTTCYSFYIDNESAAGHTGYVYRKTTDAGATWGTAVQIQSDSTQTANDVWYDQWTPGDTGTLIHMWYFDTANDKVFWRSLDTISDTLGTERTVFTGASAVAGRGSFVSGTKARNGHLYVCYDIDAGAERGIHRSTDSGTTWSTNLTGSWVEATVDECMLFPATGTGDNADIWGIYQDASTDELTMKFLDISASSIIESSSMQTCVENTGDENQRPFAGAVRLSDGHIIVTSFSELNTSTADLQVWDVSAVNSGSQTGITAKTNITTNVAQISWPSVYINSSDKIYVAYTGKRDGTETIGTSTKVYYTTSTDGGSNWSSGDTAYMQGSGTNTRQTWSSNSGPLFMVQWRQDVASPNSGNWTNPSNSVATSTGNSNFFPFLMP